MKAYEISLFYILLMFSLNMLAATGFLDSENCGIGNNEPCFTDMYSTQETHNINQTLHAPGVAPTSATDAFGYFKAGLSTFGLLLDTLFGVITLLFLSTIGFPIFLTNLGLPSPFVAIMSIGIYITYVVAIIQYKARTSLYGTE